MIALWRSLAILGALFALDVTASQAEEPQPKTLSKKTSLVFACDESNDLLRAIVAGGSNPRRFSSAKEAVEAAGGNSAVLVLADKYPDQRTAVAPEVYEKAKAKHVTLFIEYPDQVPGLQFEEPQGVHWERAIVTTSSPDLGLSPLHLLALHDCRFLPTSAATPLLVIGRVAGFDRAVYGMPKDARPILFKTQDGVWVATTKLSNFVTARYAPGADWLTLWTGLLNELNPDGAPHSLVADELVHPAFDKNQELPNDAELLAVERCANWYKNSRLLISEQREPQIHKLLRKGLEVTAPPPADVPIGDGTLGILEGYASQILPDGSQLQRLPIRADCQAETAAMLALHAKLAHDVTSASIARNLLDYLYFNSELHRLDRGNPHHPAYGLISWGAEAPAFRVANYGDDNARTLLATMACAAILESDKWDEPMLRALYANLRTTGKLGFRGDRIDMPQLESRGWREFQNDDTVNLSPSFEAYLWACYLWAYERTGDRTFLDSTKSAIRATMGAYPDGWRWGDNLDRSRMLLALAWLIRVDDTAEHRSWLMIVTADLLRNQQPCGAIPEELSGATIGHLFAPRTNEEYGTGETPLIQEPGDPVSDQLYVTNFALIGLREAVAATNDPSLKDAEEKLADYLVRIQVRSTSIPYLDGTWFRAFDFRRWDYWASSGDLGWGAWCAETGWGPAWIGIALGLRERSTSLWDMTKTSKINDQRQRVLSDMSKNQGDPFDPKLQEKDEKIFDNRNESGQNAPN